ncbi:MULTISPECIES: tryptophan transporter [Virgibacillus]|uniref:Tryptophan transporter n=1 Tax=Virgibacillus pantothenticus TaxID=1473 RepID=A0A0L0QTE7_VIRPA|nr:MULTISPECIES: tryptophan transporter [Virgibacillus]API91079.1 tryptophan transporter [Virgibacillus sp. 6R]KNE21965.1 tryptophan transporter [Virgibacillus pantothenticus]MBS7429068.1 tryptophan transporter [Virgibacillus sp. 19R1-5]MBU8566909.1 tryptophan transporter [Virgibacillus pantothenticus]MBU8600398.1 tryptophan transporter [Virgibacillus pantothenticus]
MNIRVLVTLSLLVGIGAVLHAVVPPVIFGVKPDMLLSMMFLGILLFPRLKYVMILSIATGAISALTTTAPGGQIANLIDKPITAIIFLSLFLVISKAVSPLTQAVILTAVGTMISGAIFLSVALFLIGIMDGSFIAMFSIAVLPAALLNSIIIAVVYPVVQRILKRTPQLMNT